MKMTKKHDQNTVTSNSGINPDTKSEMLYKVYISHTTSKYLIMKIYKAVQWHMHK